MVDKDRFIKVSDQISDNERDSSPDIVDLSEERDDGYSINNVRFSVINSTQSRQSFQMNAKQSKVSRGVNLSMTKRPSMNRNNSRLNSTSYSAVNVNLTESKTIRKEQFYSTMVEQNSVKFTSEKSLINEEPPTFKKNSIMKLDLSPLTAQSNKEQSKRKILAEVLRILSAQMQRPTTYLTHEVVGNLSFVNQALSRPKIGRKYVSQSMINQNIPNVFAKQLPSIRKLESLTDFNLVETMGDIKIYEHQSEVRATIYTCCKQDFLIWLLQKTDTYDQWLLGGPCKEISRVDFTTDLISFQFSKKKWFGLRKKDFKSQVLRTVFVDPESQLTYVGFQSDAFQLIVRVEDNRMLVSCRSTSHRMDLLKKVINFNVFAELSWLESPQLRQVVDSNLSLINFTTAQENQQEGMYFEESSIQNLAEQNLIDTSRDQSNSSINNCNLLTFRASSLRNVQPTIEVGSDSLAGEESDEHPFKFAKSTSVQAATSHPNEQLKSQKPSKRSPFQRPCENKEYIDAQSCKDSEGNWTKWVIERLDSTQIVVYNQFKEIIQNEAIAANLSVNKQIRNLVSCKWNAQQAAKNIIDAEQFRIDNKLEQTTLEQIRVANEMGFFILSGKDKSSRPLIWIRGALLDPKKLTRDSSVKFAAYTLDFCCSNMPPNVDQFIKIYDLKNFGSKNVNFEITKAIIGICSMLYPSCLMKIVVLNSNYVTRLIYNAVGVFLSEKQRERVFFVDPANQLKFLENIIDRDQIPAEYGGTAPTLESLGLQKYPLEYE